MAAPAIIDDTAAMAAVYHRLTAYDRDRHWAEPVDDPRVRGDFIPMRPGRLPQPFKEYPDGLPVRQLTRAPAPAPVSLADVLGGQSTVDVHKRLTSHDLSAILFQCAGVVRYRDEPGGRRSYFRAASSAGNRHPVEVYLCARQIDGLHDGVWHYDPRENWLTLIGPAPRGGCSALVFSGVPWRTGWKYAERGYRHLWWDCGTMAAQAVLAARSRSLPGRVETDFADAAVARLIGAVEGEELPLAVVPLGVGEPAIEPTGTAVRGDLGPGLEAFPLVAAVHAAGNRPDVGARVRPAGEPAGIGVPAGASDEPLDRLVLRRGSARRFDPTATLERDAVDWLVRVANGPVDGARTVDTRLVAHAVAGLAPAVYRWTGDGPSRCASADRATSRELCLGQELGHDAAALLFFVTEPELPDPRGYRELCLAAGLGLGRLYLAAAALGVGCTGLTFVDTMLPAALGQPVAGLAVAALGRTPYRPRTGGGPGSPTELDGRARPPQTPLRPSPTGLSR